MKEPRSRRGPRRLTDEEIELWASVAQSVSRRRGASLPASSRPKPELAPEPPVSLATEWATAKPAKPQPPSPPPLAPLERRLKRDLSRGRAAIDDALDLHGLNQAEAHHALRSFLFSAQARGAKVVIVVTGKGKVGVSSGSWMDEPGVLRRLAPHWLRENDMRAVVLGFEEAGRTHGGSGALYVRLRRRLR
jgi:DNA-nicking Smr family endonuclease